MDELGIDSVPAPKRAREVAAKKEHATANGSGGEAGRYSGEKQWPGRGLEAREPARARIQRASGREAERPANEVDVAVPGKEPTTSDGERAWRQGLPELGRHGGDREAARNLGGGKMERGEGGGSVL